VLTPFDDYPIHQTPLPIAHPATGDPNHYDRFWFNGYTEDFYFAAGMAMYPNRGIIDGAFAVVQDGVQRSVFASGRIPENRGETRIGPLTIEVVEPLRVTRVRADAADLGIDADVTFTARTVALEEPRQTMTPGTRTIMDSTRLTQWGTWNGRIVAGGTELPIDRVYGTKDRSWGVRGVGEPETGGAPRAPGGIFFLWAPLVWDDHITHAIFFDGPRGEALVREGITAPLYTNEADVPDALEGTDERMAGAAHRVQYHPGTRLAAHAEIDLTDLAGRTRTIELAPELRFHMKGLGYIHPEWGQGRWKGELEIGGESFDPATLPLLAIENLHVQQVVRARDGERTGIGVLEQIVIGPYAPAGFTGLLDGA